MSCRLGLLIASLNLVFAQDAPPLINTPPSVAQCLPTLISFGGGTPPYTLSAIPAGQSSAAPLADIGSATGTQKTWVTNVPAGTSITLMIRDSKGQINYSQAVTVQANGDSSCLNGASGKSPTNSTPSTGSPSTGSPSTGSQAKPSTGSTPIASGGNAAGSNASTNAASSVLPTSLWSCFAGIGFVGSALALFA